MYKRQAPALCELEDPSQLVCDIPATFAGDQHELAVKLRLEPDEERTINMRLEPNGFFDLEELNNFAELVLPGDPLPGNTGLTTQGAAGTGGNTDTTTETGSGGGGLFNLPAMLLLLLSVAHCRRARAVNA